MCNIDLEIEVLIKNFMLNKRRNRKHYEYNIKSIIDNVIYEAIKKTKPTYKLIVPSSLYDYYLD